jgi:hypothetical protein
VVQGSRGRQGEHESDRRAAHRLPELLERLGAGVPTWGGDDQQDQHERKSQPVVEAGLEIEGVSDQRGNPLGGHHRGRHDRIGRSENRPEQECLCPAQVGKQRLSPERQQDERDGHRHDQRPRGWSPMGPDELTFRHEAVREQR